MKKKDFLDFWTKLSYIICMIIVMSGCQNVEDALLSDSRSSLDDNELVENSENKEVSTRGEIPNRLPTTSEKATLQGWFPNLNVNNVIVTGAATTTYNCIAYSMGITSKWINPSYSLTAFQNQYKNAKSWYGAVNNYSVLSAYNSNAVVDGWGNNTQDMTHGSKIRSSTTWESKLGSYLRITHTRTGLEGGVYGNILTSFNWSNTRNHGYSDLEEIAQEVEVDIDKKTLSISDINVIKERANTINSDTKQKFNILFNKWKEEWQTSPTMMLSSNTNDSKKIEQYKELRAMGGIIIPLVIEKLLVEDNFFALVLYDDLQEDGSLTIKYKGLDKDCFEGEQNRALRSIKLWINK